MALTLMCGLSFAGKSTFATLLARELGAQVVSLDAINAERGLDGGQGIPLDEWATSDRVAHERVDALLRQGKHVVIDDTGSPRFIRDQWRSAANTVGVPFALVWVRIDRRLQQDRVARTRARNDRPDVTDAVLAEHAASFDSPEREEPFVVDAFDTRDPARAAAVASAIRQLAVA
ncbi:hypothetical protein GCM10025867_30070 [Frondihabitans sucicola]|uniref:ATP-binding protein n=1 Tax=Frondihabitans sucicola TaxID=1268041 RepID=A0ABN6Y151_9MICO|nr:ATP-binding protein [Frondihabitans sucicola]BDZ50766.1 hypothetical protein GCM10025867_30070 [Frondihabitans sucicola]